jgi:hypothetical protein
LIWAIAIVVISCTWAYVAHLALELMLAKQRSHDVAVLTAKVTVQAKTIESLEGDIQKIRDRLGRMELKRA